MQGDVSPDAGASPVCFSAKDLAVMDLPTAPLPPPSPLQAWTAAIRPRTLPLAVAPVIVGTALAWRDAGQVHPGPALAAAAGALLIQIATNLHNDVTDARKGSDRPDRLGPPRATALGWLPAAQIAAATWASFALAGVSGLYLIAWGGLPILLLGVASLVAGWCYSGGSRPISYGPWGEVFVIAFFGLGAVGGSYYLQTGTVSAAAASAGTAIGLFAAGVLMTNNYRDLDADRRSGRHTLALRLGVRGSRVAYTLLLTLPFLVLAVGVRQGWLAALAIPMAVGLIHRFWTLPRERVFNAILAGTAKLELVVATLLSLSQLL